MIKRLREVVLGVPALFMWQHYGTKIRTTTGMFGSIALGVISGISTFCCSLFAEWLELRSPPGTRAYSGKWGFDPDDAL